MCNPLERLFISRKDRDDVPLPLGYNSKNINNAKLFLSQNNVQDMIKTAYSIRLRYNHTGPAYDKFASAVPALMKQWAKENNIQNYSISGPHGSKDFIDLLNFTNTRFLRDHYEFFTTVDTDRNPNIPKHEQPDFNVVKPSIVVGNVNEFENSLASIDVRDIMAQDYNSLDVWRDVSTYVANDNYSRGNEIKKDQIRMHSRNYDRDVDGLRSTAERSSLVNVRMPKYDMSRYVATHTDDQQRYKHIRFDY